MRGRRIGIVTLRRTGAALMALSVMLLLAGHAQGSEQGRGADAAPLPGGVRAVWDLDKAHRQATPTRERVSINGLWRWQPATVRSAGFSRALPPEGGTTNSPPAGRWGFFKVPGSWPGITNYMQKDSQTVFSHESWNDQRLAGVTAAWYQREITIPADWAGRRIVLRAEYLNSYAVVYLDGRKAGEMRFPAGEVDVTPLCRPGSAHVLSMYVVAMPLKDVMLSFSDTASARQTRGSVARRGLCGDVWLESRPAAARIDDVKVRTSTRKWEIEFTAALENLDAASQHTLQADITQQGRSVATFTSRPFQKSDLSDGRIAFSETWKPDRLWDIHTPENQYELTLSLLDAAGKAVDVSYPSSFGFREFWIDGRDFYLNGTRIFLSALPLDNAQVGAAAACYDGARESLLRLKSIGINFVYTHNYGCEPGTHLGFSEVLKAADDVGMLVALSQPHFGQYEWQADDAEATNGYAGHARFYVDVAGNHASVVMYSMSHNATGYAEDMNPDMMAGATAPPRNEWSERNAQRAVRAETIVERLDPGRIVYHHASGNLGSMHTTNFYTNFAPIQELSDWFGRWAAEGVKPVFTCEYMVPCTWDWTMYRGWYKGSREFGSATVPWEFCQAEWSAQFLGDRAYRIGEPEKQNLRWEARQFREGKLWHRWDYPYQVGDKTFDDQHEVIARYLNDNWRAFRTWGVSAVSPWEHHFFWSLRPGVDKSRREMEVDWEHLQRPGFSPDYLDERYERMDLAFERSDWAPTADGQAILRNNLPLLAYVAGKPAAFTSKDHNFQPGETVEKQLIVINNSRETVQCDCQWKFVVPASAGISSPKSPPEGGTTNVAGSRSVTVETGQQTRIPLRFALPPDLAPGTYTLNATFRFSDGQTQRDRFAVHVLATPSEVDKAPRIAIFDPAGETAALLAGLGVNCQAVDANADLAGVDVLVVGKHALTVDGPGPDVARVRDGLTVLVFEQTADVLEKRLGFRVAEYGLRQAFQRVPDHPLLAGIDAEHLRDWRGEATLLPPRLTYELSPRFNYVPTVQWCNIEVPRVWRCGNRGNVASALIEKPARGDFLPILDGGYSLQYSPLMEYREGSGTVLFCQMDVTGRTESDPAAVQLVHNILSYAFDRSSRPSVPERQAVYVGDPAGDRHLALAGIDADPYQRGKLPPESVLVVGSGGAGKLVAGDVAAFLKAGGHLLALGLDQRETESLLPLQVGMKTAEHIAACFTPAAADSPLAGIGPADVHNRAPRQLPLVSGGAQVVGDGVLATALDGRVALFQLPPYAITRSEGALTSFVVDDQDAAEGKRSALVTLGAISAAGGQFGQAVKTAPSVGKTYTFAALVKGAGGDVLVHLEIERAGSPWDRAVKGDDVLAPADKWTELHVTFTCEKPFPEGWQAYIGCSQDGGRFRADALRLYEGEYAPWKPAARTAAAEAAERPRNLIANPGFENGEKPWWLMFRRQNNLRRTYRRASFVLARLLSNMGVRGETPLLSRFSTPADAGQRAVGPTVVRNGDFSRNADDGPAADWQFTSESSQASCRREPLADGPGSAIRLAMPGYGGKDRASVMLAQHDVAVREGQWYRISLKAKAEGLGGKRVSLALQNTENWTSLFDYQRFTPADDWRTFEFLVQAKATAQSKTRFQIWHENLGTLWLADVGMVPVAPPQTEGRWSNGLYVDQPEAWDDPYRFFRW